MENAFAIHKYYGIVIVVQLGENITLKQLTGKIHAIYFMICKEEYILDSHN